jgi:hypothetical protein
MKYILMIKIKLGGQYQMRTYKYNNFFAHCFSDNWWLVKIDNMYLKSVLFISIIFYSQFCFIKGQKELRK